jgi:hypothetical protein
MSRKMKVGDEATTKNCIGCQVLVQRDETNEQNINFHRQEMVERWRLQEMANASIQESIKKLADTETSHWEHVHKFEKGVIYATIANIAAAAISVGSRFIK